MHQSLCKSNRVGGNGKTQSLGSLQFTISDTQTVLEKYNEVKYKHKHIYLPNLLL